MLLTLSVYVPRPPFVIKLLPPVVLELAVWLCVVPLGLIQVAATVAPGTAAQLGGDGCRRRCGCRGSAVAGVKRVDERTARIVVACRCRGHDICSLTVGG